LEFEEILKEGEDLDFSLEYKSIRQKYVIKNAKFSK
jgi:hypothetical protein